MSPAKKKSTPAPAARFPKLTALLTGWVKFLILGLLFVGVFAVAGYEVWQFVRGKVLASEEYQPWPMPPWVQPDPRLDVYERLRRNGPVSIMDADLTAERITAAFEQNAWVAKVHKVTKKYPATVEVELDYRRPVLMVQIGVQAYAVDAEGISLPTQGCFTPVEIPKYPRLVGVDQAPAIGEGKRWGDSRVIGGAEIANALLPLWEKLHLKRIVPRAISLGAAGSPTDLTQSPQFGEYHFDIIAPGPPDEKGIPGEKRFYWGRAPVDKISQDSSPAQKAKKLEDLDTEFGGLEKCPEKYCDLNRP